MADQVPILTLQQAFRYLWFVDVKKDHGPKDFDKDVVTEILPNDPANNSFITNLSMTKEALFESIISMQYDIFQKLPVKDSTLGTPDGKITVLPTGIEYDFKVFALDPTDKLVSKIQGYLQNLDKPILCFTDTTRHGAEFIAKWPQDVNPNFLHAHSREIQNDPCDKLNITTSLDGKGLTDVEKEAYKKRFYYENKTPGITEYLEYPIYTNGGLPLEDFYCNRRVSLQLRGMLDPKKKELDVNLYYWRMLPNGQQQQVIIEEDSNKASAFTKVKARIFQLLNLKGNTKKNIQTAKESVFIGKHHGDIGQVLACNRRMVLTSAINDAVALDSSTCYTAFESYDVNPCVKAMLENVDIILFHNSGTPDHRLNILTHQKFRDPRIKLKTNFDLLEKEVKLILEKLQTDIALLDNKRKYMNFYLTELYRVTQIINTNVLIIQGMKTPEEKREAINKLYKEVLIKFAAFAAATYYLVPGSITDNIVINIDEKIGQYTQYVQAIQQKFTDLSGNTSAALQNAGSTNAQLNTINREVLDELQRIKQISREELLPLSKEQMISPFIIDADGTSSYIIPPLTLENSPVIRKRGARKESNVLSGMDLVKIDQDYTKKELNDILVSDIMFPAQCGSDILLYIFNSLKEFKARTAEGVELNLAGGFLILCNSICFTETAQQGYKRALILSGLALPVEAALQGGRVPILLDRTLLQDKENLQTKEFQLTNQLTKEEYSIYKDITPIEFTVKLPDTTEIMSFSMSLGEYYTLMEIMLEEIDIYLNFYQTILSLDMETWGTSTETDLKSTENNPMEEFYELVKIFTQKEIVTNKLCLEFIDTLEKFYQSKGYTIQDFETKKGGAKTPNKGRTRKNKKSKVIAPNYYFMKNKNTLIVNLQCGILKNTNKRFYAGAEFVRFLRRKRKNIQANKIERILKRNNKIESIFLNEICKDYSDFIDKGELSDNLPFLNTKVPFVNRPDSAPVALSIGIEQVVNGGGKQKTRKASKYKQQKRRFSRTYRKH